MVRPIGELTNASRNRPAIQHLHKQGHASLVRTKGGTREAAQEAEWLVTVDCMLGEEPQLRLSTDCHKLSVSPRTHLPKTSPVLGSVKQSCPYLTSTRLRMNRAQSPS